MVERAEKLSFTSEEALGEEEPPQADRADAKETAHSSATAGREAVFGMRALTRGTRKARCKRRCECDGKRI